MREILENCTKITQGTIFTNAKSNDFQDDVYGILLNGRCDIEHPNHYDNFLYLPIVPYEAWETKIAVKKVLERKHNDIIAILEKYKDRFSYEALLYLPEHIEETIAKSIKKQKEQEKIKNALLFLRVYNKYKKDLNFLENEITDFKSAYSSDINVLRKDLIENKLPDSVYLENVDINDQKQQIVKKYVGLITEIHSIPKKAIIMLENGIDLEFQKEFKQYFGKDNLIIPCANLTSPYIEHLIQKMKELFRVGVDRAEDFEI